MDIGFGPAQAAIVLFFGIVGILCGLVALLGGFSLVSLLPPTNLSLPLALREDVYDIYPWSLQPGITLELNAPARRKGESVSVESIIKLFISKPLDEEYTTILEGVERALRGAADAISIELRHRLYPPEDYADDKVEGAFKRP
jgi:hypothetical protein